MDPFFSALTFKNIIDVLLVAAVAVYAYRLLRRSGAVNLFWGLFAFVIVWVLASYVFDLKLTGALFNQIVSVGAIAIIVIFQNEIRAFFYRVGSTMGKGLSWGKMHRQQETQRVATELETALRHMSATKTGALIILTGKQDLSEYADSGEQLDAAVSARLIETVFFKNSPLHDGALLITDGRLRSAGSILPVSTDKSLPSHYGLRHRAALGLTEQTDATALVVSEETGQIAIAIDNTIREVTKEELTATLTGFFIG